MYRQTFPLYFPRSAEEESYAAKALPASIGDEMGEPIITERQIRILENPTTKGEHYSHLSLSNPTWFGHLGTCISKYTMQ